MTHRVDRDFAHPRHYKVDSEFGLRVNYRCKPRLKTVPLLNGGGDVGIALILNLAARIRFLQAPWKGRGAPGSIDGASRISTGEITGERVDNPRFDHASHGP